MDKKPTTPVPPKPQEVFAEIVTKKKQTGERPSPADLNRLIGAIGRPGVDLELKKQAVRDLYKEIGGGVNPQGYHVADTIETLENY